jgi:hypothetical protein
MAHYEATVEFSTEEVDKKTGNEKMKKSTLIVTGSSFHDAYNNLLNYLDGDMRSFEIVGLKKTKYEAIVETADVADSY